MIKRASDPHIETILRTREYQRIGNEGVHAAQEANRRMGVPNVYSINGIIYYELPNGELSRTDPYQGDRVAE